MKVRSLQITNFKSYAGTQEIGPFSDFTAIIGTNASGKSNCFDAICFVLGASATMLRCRDLKDLIWKGDGDKSITSSVQMTLYNDLQQEKTFRRTIKENGCKYFVDGAKVSAADYKSALCDIGFHSIFQSYIIFQGVIGSMASMKTKDLTLLLETLSGSIAYKENYDNLEKQLEEISKRTKEAFQQESELSDRYRELKAITAETNKYKDLNENKKSTEITLMNFILYQNSLQCQRIGEEIREYNEKIGFLKNSSKDQKDIANDMNNVIKTTKGILKNAEKAEKEISMQLEDIMLQKKLASSQQENSVTKQKELEMEVKNLKQKKKEEKDNKKCLEKKIAAFSKDNENVLSQRSRIHDIALSVNNAPLSPEMMIKKQEYEKSKLDMNIAESNLKRLSVQLDNLKSIESSMGKEPEIIEMMEEPNYHDNEILNIKSKIARNQELYENACIKYRSNNKLKQQNNMLQKLQNSTQGVHGFVREIFRPIRAKYEQAIASGIGYHCDEIIVDDFDTACRCISILKQFNLGKATFIPLDIEVKNHETISDGNITPLSNYIECDPKYKPIINHCCGDVFLCEDDSNISAAWKSKRYKKLINLQGTIYKSNGCLTGGNIGNSSGLRINPEKIKEEIRVLNEKLKDLERVDSELVMEYTKMFNAYKSSITAKNLYNEKKQRITHEIEMKENEFARMQKEYDEANERCTIAKEASEIMNENETKLHTELLQQLSDNNRDLLEQLSLNNIEELIELDSKFTELESEISNDKLQLEYINQSTTDDKIKEKKQELSACSNSIKSLTKEIKSLNKRIEDIQNDLNNAQQNIYSARDDVSKAVNKKKELLAKSNDSLKEARQLESKIQMIERNYNRSKRIIEENLPKTRFSSFEEVINDPFSDLSDDLKIVFRPSEFDSKIKKMRKSILRYEDEMNKITPNFKAAEDAVVMREKKHESKALSLNLRKEQKEIFAKFQDVKRKRKDCFQTALNKVRQEVSYIYGKLTSTKTQPLGGTAFLSPDREDMPFKGGTLYSVIPPHKKERTLDILSGGEQTIAIVALAFALNSIKPAPIFVLDEIDSALDARNVKQLSEFLCTQTIAKQLVIISHKATVFSQADILIGIARRNGFKSRAFRFVLKDFENKERYEDEPNIVIAGAD